MTSCGPETFGTIPVNMRWNVVRGDTASITVEFFESDEETYIDISAWDFVATAYDPKGQQEYELEVDVDTGTVVITAPSDTTSEWGTGVGQRVLQLHFDLEVTNDEYVVWTPIVGTISVTGDISGGNL